MDRAIAEAVVTILSQHGEYATLRKEYSGRDMFGKNTTAVETDASMLEFGFALGQINSEDKSLYYCNLGKIQQDTMGRCGYIYY